MNFVHLKYIFKKKSNEFKKLTIVGVRNIILGIIYTITDPDNWV